MAISDRPVELTDNVLEAVKNGQQSAIEAVRKFVDKLDQSVPLSGEGASKRQEVIDSALEMADKLVENQYHFLRTVVRSAGSAVGSTVGDSAKED